MGMFDVITGKSGAKAAKKAAKYQAEAFNKGTKEIARQFDETQANLQPFLDAGTEAIPFVNQGSTFQGLNQRLAAIFNSDYFAPLEDERQRAVQNQLASSGLRRSGAGMQAATAVPTDIALAIESMMHGRQSNLMGSGQNAAARMGAFGANAAGQIASNTAAAGQAIAGGITGAAQARSAGLENILGTILGGARIWKMSDERLKENMRPIGKIGGLTLYEWDWIEAYKEMTDADMDLGFSAQEVERKYPEYVREINGYKAINYKGLMEAIK